MSRPVIVSMLWPKNQAVSVELARRFAVDILAPAVYVSPERVRQIESFGCRFLNLDAACAPIDPEKLTSAASEKYSRLEPALKEHITAIAGAQLGPRVAGAMLRVIAEKFASSMATIETLEAFHSRERISALVLNESETPSGKTAALWAKNNAIPVFVLSHGVGMGEVYSVTRDFVADYLLFVGDRGTEGYRDVGFPDDRMTVCGNPAWDEYPALLAQRGTIRSQVCSTLGLDPQIPTVLFGTTWNAKLTGLYDSAIFEQTLRAFLQGCKDLSGRGVRFNAVVKDRPPNAEFGSNVTRRLAQEIGFEQCKYATGDILGALLASDVFVSYESSTFVEAAIAAVPSIALWTPSTFTMGPALDCSDAVPYVNYRDTGMLADVMQRLLSDSQARAQAISAQTARLPRFSAALDGRAAERCAKAIAVRLGLGDRASVAGSFASLVRTAPGVIVDVGLGESNALRELRSAYPQSLVVAVTPEQVDSPESNLNSADIVVLERILERMYDPWSFLLKLKCKLRAGARVLASISNARNVTFISEMVQGRLGYGAGGQRDMRQVRFFTRKTISELFSQTGYVISGIQPVHDAKISVPPIPANATFDLDAGAFAIKAVGSEELDELRTLEFLVDARPA